MTPLDFLQALYQHKFHFMTGVPDSVFKYLIDAVKNDARFQHVITNNEGESCALAAGYYLATGKIPVVYMQNSGLGNCINPLTSLLDEWIYSIPSLLLIGWRAKPGEQDEPQHQRMGSILLELLTLLEIPYVIVDTQPHDLERVFSQVQQHFASYSKPFALIFAKQVLTAPLMPAQVLNYQMTGVVRENLLECLVINSQPHYLFVTTTGKTSREFYEVRERFNQSHECDFLTVGSMGCAGSIGLGIAIQRPEKRVIVVDGDGACLMRLEALATIGHVKPANFLHILIDNNAYESTGSQQTQSHHIDFAAVALACGYHQSVTVISIDELIKEYLEVIQGPRMIVVRTIPTSRDNLGRPKMTPLENKRLFMKRLGAE